MATEKRFSSVAHNYPSFLDIHPQKLNAYNWMKSRTNDDNAEGLWRVHDGLYDLTNLIGWHPGGEDWIRLTKGTDITEAFEVHHLNYEKVKNVLKEYWVRDAKLPRNFKFTFKESGFYSILRRRVAEQLETIETKWNMLKSKVFIDVLLFLSLLTAILSVRFDNYSRYLIILSGISICYTVNAAHNFLHRRDNFRMFYFNFSFLNYKGFRISHCMSHHLFPNSLFDMEILQLEPFFCWIPSPMKTFSQRYLSWLYAPIIYTAIFFDQLIKRIIFSILTQKNRFEGSDAIPFIVPFVMILFGNANLYITFITWTKIVFVSSFTFGLIGLNAGHHSNDLVQDGDKMRDDLDWGIYSMDTIMDVTEFRKHHFVALTHYGHHALHHLFPTIDHGVLPRLYPVLFQTMKEYELELDVYPWYHIIFEQLKLLSCTQTNSSDPVERMRRKKIQRKNE